MSELAKLIELIRNESGFTLTVNGEEFPWFITEDGVNVKVDARSGIPQVTLTILAGRVTVDDRISS